MKKLFFLVPFFIIFNCDKFTGVQYINHPVTISFVDFYNNPVDSKSEIFDKEKKDLVFKELSVSAKAITKRIDKIKNENSDTSYFVIQGTLVIGESSKGLVLVKQNEMFLVPRNIEHSLVPYENKAVKVIIHSSNH